MRVCPSCGRENAEDARFCSWCATSLAPEAQREERKVVTCLFCDLVGFTARAEQMDPEDVRRLLQPYHTRVRAELERYGGTVEKFIGDAVMAIFGAPVAHEDDPERAVRAALDIREVLAEGGDLEVRIGITTGEALVALGARPEVGEGMASGDVVNTAARLQSAAPTNGVLVDETTYRATARAIEYGQARTVEAKGKSEPLAVREALRARARIGVERVGGAPLVGREQELTLLRETFARVVRERGPQLVTLVGVPGIGKSRLVYELFRTIESGRFGLVFWRHGRSLPYGDGVTFWALSEMIKAQAGILETDDSEQSEAKLRAAVERLLSDEVEAGWVVQHLRPLAGLESEKTWASDRRGEAFAAWRRFLEALAEERPLALVFEDLQWADDGLLDFVDYLLDWARDVPLLVLGTARPELLVRRTGWGGGKMNSSTILVSPLSDEETAGLLHALLGHSVIDADLQRRLLEHAGGNPLYAEEFTRMLIERPAGVVVPETVQGMVAARIDTLPREEKELLQDAAVMGKVFWLGALGAERWTLAERLHSLERKEFVARQRHSSVAGEEEFAFRHTLVRDVAYEQIPKAERADKHRLAGEWIASLGRTEDRAEMLAHHYASALDYAIDAGRDAGLFAERARVALREAGDRALALNTFAHAVRFFERALELWPEDGQGELLLRYGSALSGAGDDRCLGVLDRAARELEKVGDAQRSAEAHALLTLAFHWRGQRDLAFGHIDRALALVREGPPSPAKAQVLTELSRLLVLAEREDGLAISEEAFAMATDLGLPGLAARALNNLGLARWEGGDVDGAAADLERSIELYESVNSPDASRGYHNLGVLMGSRAEFARAIALLEESVRVGERVGGAFQSRPSRAILVATWYSIGEWDAASKGADEVIAQFEQATPLYFEHGVLAVRAKIRLARGESETLVLEDVRRAVELARPAGDLQVLVPVFAGATFVFHELGHLDDASATANELVQVLRPSIAGLFLADFAWVAQAVGCADEIRGAISSVDPQDVWRRAVLAILDQDFVGAAEIYASIGHVDEGYARLRAAEKLLGERRAADAEVQLQRALAIFRPLRATRYVRRAESLLVGAGLGVSA